MINIKLQKKLDVLAEVLVPETFREDAPQFYDLIKAFLVNIQDVQDSINMNFIDSINVKDIDNNEILKLYFDVYFAQLNLGSEIDYTQIKDLLKVSKDLSILKGTPFIFAILTKLLIYLIPVVKNQYLELKALLDNPDLTEHARNEILKEMDDLREEGYLLSTTNVYEVDTFSYVLESDFSVHMYEKYIKPFCHPAGWHDQFIQVYHLMVTETTKLNNTFMICEVMQLPIPKADGSVSSNDLSYPNTFLTDKLLAEGDALYYELKDYLSEPDRLYIYEEKVLADGIIIANGSHKCDGIINLKTYYKETLWTDNETIIGNWNDGVFQCKIPSGKIPLKASNVYIADGGIKANYSMIANGINNEFVQTYYLEGDI